MTMGIEIILATIVFAFLFFSIVSEVLGKKK
jgi:hypothetical protein